MKPQSVLAPALAAALLFATPAFAQMFTGPAPRVDPDIQRAPEVDQRAAFLAGMVGKAQAAGKLNWQAAVSLQNQLHQMRFTEQNFRMTSGGGLAKWQRVDLNGRLDRVAEELRDNGG